MASEGEDEVTNQDGKKARNDNNTYASNNEPVGLKLSTVCKWYCLILKPVLLSIITILPKNQTPPNQVHLSFLVNHFITSNRLADSRQSPSPSCNSATNCRVALQLSALHSLSTPQPQLFGSYLQLHYSPAISSKP